MPEPILDGYMEREELAKELKKSKRTLDRMAVLRQGPPRTVVGRRILYRRESVLAWLKSLEQRNEPQPRRKVRQ